MSYSKFHSNGKPIIISYEDAFRYLGGEKRQPSLITAMALHVFHLKLRDAIKNNELALDRRMTRDETDTYIRGMVGTSDLDDFRVYAERLVADTLISRHQRNTWFRIIPVGGAWAGFLGNMLTLFVGFLFALAVTIYRQDNTSLRFLDFVNRCIKMD